MLRVIPLLLGVVALVLLFLPQTSSAYPPVLVRAMLLLVVGLALAVARDGLRNPVSSEVLSEPPWKIYFQIGLGLVLIGIWVLWTFDFWGIRHYL
jgi:hypothetical protein